MFGCTQVENISVQERRKCTVNILSVLFNQKYQPSASLANSLSCLPIGVRDYISLALALIMCHVVSLNSRQGGTWNPL